MRPNQTAICLGCRKRVSVGNVTARAGENGQYVLCSGCVAAGFQFKRQSEIYSYMKSRMVMLFCPAGDLRTGPRRRWTRWTAAVYVKRAIQKELAAEAARTGEMFA